MLQRKGDGHSQTSEEIKLCVHLIPEGLESLYAALLHTYSTYTKT